MNFELKKAKITIVGLGYVGLPLAIEFSKQYTTVGFDINANRVAELRKGIDSTLECSEQDLKNAVNIKFTNVKSEIEESNVYIVTVPTPIDKNKQPDLEPLRSASELIGTVISKGDVVVFESTVYPGVTEDFCVPIISKISGLEYNKDFFAGYSPERINPGDKTHRVTNILKVTSGSNRGTAIFVDNLYSSIITAGTYLASSIKVAEASKLIENVQRDVNIALVNELHQIFTKINIDTAEVIDAASTKWNFMKLYPGLVGGHCISVDPYYLLQKASDSNYIPDLIRTGREINDTMASFLAQDFLRNILKNRINPVDCRVTIFGFSFKENCPDIRNTKIVDLYNELISLGFIVNVVDDWVNPEEAMSEYGIEVSNEIETDYDAAFLAVGHASILERLKFTKNKSYVYDFKGLLK